MYLYLRTYSAGGEYVEAESSFVKVPLTEYFIKNIIVKMELIRVMNLSLKEKIMEMSYENWAPDWIGAVDDLTNEEDALLTDGDPLLTSRDIGSDDDCLNVSFSEMNVADNFIYFSMATKFGVADERSIYWWNWSIQEVSRSFTEPEEADKINS